MIAIVLTLNAPVLFARGCTCVGFRDHANTALAWCNALRRGDLEYKTYTYGFPTWRQDSEVGNI
eukprot:3966393-Alexandrium_andersonii.AAC.2